jgi:DNA polymerase-3 subunit gamma/tau
MARAVYAPAEFQSNTAASLTLSLPNPVHRTKCEQHRDVVEKALNEAVGAAVTLTRVRADESGDGGGTSDGDGGGAGGGSQNSAGAQDGDSSSVDAGASRATGAANEAGERGRSEGDSAADDIAHDEGPGTAAGSPFGDDSVAATDVAQQTPRQAAEPKSADASNGLEPSADGGNGSSDAEIHVLPQDHEVDLGDLVDAPPESVKTPIDRLAEAFPGSELVEDTY